MMVEEKEIEAREEEERKEEKASSTMSKISRVKLISSLFLSFTANQTSWCQSPSK